MTCWFQNENYPAWARDGLRRKQRNRWQYHSDLVALWKKYSEPSEPVMNGTSLGEAKRRREIAKAELAELELAEARRRDELARGNMLRRDEWERFAKESIGIARDRMASVPKSLAKLGDSDEQQRRLLKEATRIIEAALNGLAKAFAEGATD